MASACSCGVAAPGGPVLAGGEEGDGEVPRPVFAHASVRTPKHASARGSMRSTVPHTNASLYEPGPRLFEELEN
jgi:hypothetical protein